jgi:hypothetical protein
MNKQYLVALKSPSAFKNATKPVASQYVIELNAKMKPDAQVEYAKEQLAMEVFGVTAVTDSMIAAMSPSFMFFPATFIANRSK